MKWISVKENVPHFTDVLVMKTYLDAPYTEFGYDDRNSYWTDPQIQIDTFYGKNGWLKGGKALFWMPLPNPPKEN